MSAAMLNWRSLMRSSNPQFLVSGSVLSVAFFGPNKRFAAYEVRTWNRDVQVPDRTYVVRDAEAIQDADVAAGKLPPIVGRTDDYDMLLAVVAKVNSSRRVGVAPLSLEAP